MASRPTLGIILAAARDNANLVWVAMGRGTAFNIPLFDTPGKFVGLDEPAAWYFFDHSAEKAQTDEWQAMQDGALPAPVPGVVWGEDGVISAADAMAAVARSNMTIAIMTGDLVAPEEFRNGILAAANLYLATPET